MPILSHKTVKLRPVVAETGPIGVGAPAAPTPTPTPFITSLFVLKHQNFIDQINALERCFAREDLRGFTPEELEEHIVVALQDNFILEDGDSGRFCTMQVANDLREQLKGYVWKSSY